MASGGQRWRGPCEEGPPETEHSSLTTLWVSQMTFGSLHRTWSGGASPCMPTGAPGNTRANVVPRARPAQALRRREATHPARHADAGTSGGAQPLPGGSSKGGRRKASGSARSTEPGVRGVVNRARRKHASRQAEEASVPQRDLGPALPSRRWQGRRFKCRRQVVALTDVPRYWEDTVPPAPWGKPSSLRRTHETPAARTRDLPGSVCQGGRRMAFFRKVSSGW